MASSSNKPGFVHFTLIFFVMLSIILGVVTYITYRDSSRFQAELEQTKTDLNKEKNLARTQDETIAALKTLISSQFNEQYPVGLDEQDNPNTVFGKARNVMFTTAGNLPSPDLLTALQTLRTNLDTLTQQKSALEANLDGEVQQRQSLRKTQAEELGVARNARTEAERELSDLISKKEEEIEAKNAENTQLTQDYRRLQIEVDQVKSQMANVEREKENEIQKLLSTNDYLRRRLQDVEQVSFERADGEIVMVDKTARTVWINVGSADKLKPRMTFSVYSQSHNGVGRGGADDGGGTRHIKGSVEVTRVVDSHLAEARILKENYTQPMFEGDPIYTPLWSPGRTENFSLVGGIDLDGDGESDRQELHELIKAAGGAIDNEVDDQGNRTGDGINVNTKFLVVGEIPEITSASTAEEQSILERMGKAHEDMEREARIQGVRVVNLNRFLEYIGYKPQRRLFVPGDVNRKYTLQPEVSKSAVRETLGNSSGNVSGVYSRSQRLRKHGASKKIYWGNKNGGN